jgi:hypothetical protein
MEGLRGLKDGRPWRNLLFFDAQHSGFARNESEHAMSEMGRILIVEDDPRAVELTLTALEEYNLVNEVGVTRDGKEALDYLNCRAPE